MKAFPKTPPFWIPWSQLNDLRSAEHQMLDALPKFADASSSSDLKRVLERQLRVSKDHVHRINEIFAKLGMAHDGETCEGMRGLIRDSQRILKAGGAPRVKDTALINAAQELSLYELAEYNALRGYAKDLHLPEAENLIEGAIREENEINDHLLRLSEGSIYDSPMNGQTPT